MCLAVLVAAVSAGSYGGFVKSSAYEAPLLKKFIPIVRLVGNADNAGNYGFE